MKDQDLTLQDRITKAIERIQNGQGGMRIPAEATDPDIVLAHCRGTIQALEEHIASLHKLIGAAK